VPHLPWKKSQGQLRWSADYRIHNKVWCLDADRGRGWHWQWQLIWTEAKDTPTGLTDATTLSPVLVCSQSLLLHMREEYCSHNCNLENVRKIVRTWVITFIRRTQTSYRRKATAQPPYQVICDLIGQQRHHIPILLYFQLYKIYSSPQSMKH